MATLPAPCPRGSSTDNRLRLSGPSRRIDPRVNAVRPDIADIALSDRVLASHYARPLVHGCIVPSAMMRDAPSPDARAVSELLHGEDFAVVDVTGDWAWGYALGDHYVGYLPLATLDVPVAASLRVVSAAPIFSTADIKSPVRGRLAVGAMVSGVVDGDFVAAAGGHVHRRHLRPIDRLADDPVAVAEALAGTPYVWGGRSGDGIDCSGLVQLAFALAGQAVPRDSDQQAAVIGAPLTQDAPLRRGDVVFFPGHVGLMADADMLVHANAHWMAVTVEPLADVLARGPGAMTVRRP